MTVPMRAPAVRSAIVSRSPDASTRAGPTVLVIDDRPLFAESLAFALRLQGVSSLRPSDIPLNVLHIADQIHSDEVDVVVLGLRLDDSVGIAVIEACRAADVRVLIVAGSYDHEIEAAALLAGAEAVIDRARPFDDLATDLFSKIVRDAANIQRPAPVAAPIGREIPRPNSRRRAFESLSRREREVLRCLMDGQTVDEFAGDAELAVATVRSHVHAILTKLGVNCQLAAVAAAHRAGWKG